jgi:hypothetical protein
VRVFAHEICIPVKWIEPKKQKQLIKVRTTLSHDIANLYLHGLEGQFGLKPFKGITTAPILSDDGSFRVASGYDEASGLWCHEIPDIYVPEQLSEADAHEALYALRYFFHTFAFADAETIYHPELEINVVNIAKDVPIGLDESTYLASLMTTVCRASLTLAPGMLATAPAYSGAGTGKGLAMKAICIIGSGVTPAAFTGGHNYEEFDKRLTAALIDARPAAFLDNYNTKNLSSDTLASALTENLCQVRPLEQTKMLPPARTRAYDLEIRTTKPGTA